MIDSLQSLLALNAVGVTVLSVSIVCDIITGLIRAVLNHDVKSSKFKDGLLKKALDYILVVIGTSLDVLCKTDYVCATCIYCLIAMECFSCVENLRDYIPIPAPLMAVLDSIQKRGENE